MIWQVIQSFLMTFGISFILTTLILAGIATLWMIVTLFAKMCFKSTAKYTLQGIVIKDIQFELSQEIEAISKHFAINEIMFISTQCLVTRNEEGRLILTDKRKFIDMNKYPVLQDYASSTDWLYLERQESQMVLSAMVWRNLHTQPIMKSSISAR